jgi:P pilus assembly chaperone PapD
MFRAPPTFQPISFRALILPLAAALVWLIWLTGSAEATIRVSPLFIDLASQGDGARDTVVITNERDVGIAIEVKALKIAPDAGATGETAADHAFAVVPPQAFIEPGRSQQFRLVYLGDPNIAQSVEYHLAFQELPLSAGAPRAGNSVSLLLDLRVEVNVSPPGSSPELLVAALRAGADEMTFTIANAGTRYAVLGDYVFDVLDRNDEVLATFSGEQLLSSNPSTKVPALSSRSFSMPIVEEAAAGLRLKPIAAN